MDDDPSDDHGDETFLGAARIFAGWYQFVVFSDRDGFRDEDNWTEEKVRRGFAGSPAYRVIGTDAHLNDHWIELVASDVPPNFDEWHRITCCYFHSANGAIGIVGIDQEPPIAAKIPPGDYTIYAAARNLGVDREVLGEDRDISDAELATRKDMEWYRIFLVPGVPAREGRMKDSTSARDLFGSGTTAH